MGCECSGAPWQWFDESLETWDPRRFCALLGNRTMLFIGDSTLEQSASTLMNAAAAAGCQEQIALAMGDTLVHRHYGNMNRGRRWTHWMDTLKPDIAIISAGAHIHCCNDSTCQHTAHHCPFDYSAALDGHFHRVFDEVLLDIVAYQKSSPGQLILWKTQQPGGCTKAISDGFGTEESQHKYNYRTFRPRDEIVIARLRALGLPFLDLRALYNRSDAHVCSGRYSADECPDCLHFCMPGALDILPGVLQTALAQHAAEALLRPTKGE
jgi:hypothetical protein